jgi:hypothetical protein
MVIENHHKTNDSEIFTTYRGHVDSSVKNKLKLFSISYIGQIEHTNCVLVIVVLHSMVMGPSFQG